MWRVKFIKENNCIPNNILFVRGPSLKNSEKRNGARHALKDWREIFLSTFKHGHVSASDQSSIFCGFHTILRKRSCFFKNSVVNSIKLMGFYLGLGLLLQHNLLSCQMTSPISYVMTEIMTKLYVSPE